MHGKFEDYCAHSIFANMRSIKPIIIRFLLAKCTYADTFPQEHFLCIRRYICKMWLLLQIPKHRIAIKIILFWKFEGTFKKKCYILMLSSEHFYCRWASYFGRWFLVNLVCTINHKPWWQHRVVEPLAISIIKWSKQMGWIIPWNTNWNQFHVIMKSHSKTVTLNV